MNLAGNEHSPRAIDGKVLRAWRRARGWDVQEMARQLRQAASGPLAAQLPHMIRAWERGDHELSERYELLYLKIFRPNGAGPHPDSAGEGVAGALRSYEESRQWEIDAMEAAALRRAGAGREAEIRAMAAELRVIQKQVDAIGRRLAELAGGDPGGRP